MKNKIIQCLILLLVLLANAQSFGQRQDVEFQAATIRKLFLEHEVLSEGEIKINDKTVTTRQWSFIRADTFRVEVLKRADSLRVKVFFLTDNNTLAVDSSSKLIKNVPCRMYKPNQRFFGVSIEWYDEGRREVCYRLLENVAPLK